VSELTKKLVDLITCSKILLGNVLVAQLVKNFPHLLEAEIVLSCSKSQPVIPVSVVKQPTHKKGQF
jgi:hypothetical protein